jgi:hypothetical protein
VKGVQIQDTINREPDGVVHCSDKLRKICFLRHGF